MRRLVRLKHVVSAVERHEFGARNARGNFLPERERHAHVVTHMHDQGRCLHFRQQVDDIDVGCLDQEALRHFGRGAEPRELVQGVLLFDRAFRDEL